MIPFPELELEDSIGTIFPLNFPDRGTTQISGLGMPPIKHWTTRAPYQTGESHWGYTIQPRVINLVVYLRACTRTGMYGKRKANIAMLNPMNSPMKLRLTYPDNQRFELHDVWYTGGYELDSSDQPTPTRQIGGVQLVANDPIWKWVTAPLGAGQTHDADGRSCVSDNTFTLTPQLVFPFTGPWLMGTTVATESWTVTNSGSWAVLPTIHVTGPVDDFVITNTTTGKQLTWDGYAIAALETVTFDIQNKEVTNGAGTNLITYVGGNFGTFAIEPGTNTVTFWAGGGVVNAATTVQICWFVEVLGT